MNTQTLTHLRAKLRQRREIVRDMNQLTMGQGDTYPAEQGTKGRPPVATDSGGKLLSSITRDLGD